MSSTPQIEANRANSQLSTGPRTPEGKAASSSNSTKLGFYAKQAVLLTPEDHADFHADRLRLRLRTPPLFTCRTDAFQPSRLAAWNIERANRLEAQLAANRAERNFHKCLKELRASQATRPAPQSNSQNKPNYVVNANGSNVRILNLGRNEPCPCNSGRKCKHCCLENEPNSGDITAHAA